VNPQGHPPGTGELAGASAGSPGRDAAEGPRGDLAGQGFVLNVFKESPWTSHDAVARVRRILSLRRVGHTGTLDPFATGVLLCCVGRATKLSDALMDLRKEYEGWLRFGVKTTTGDATGNIECEWNLPLPAEDRLRTAAQRFTGETLQVPPMVSALKHEGQRLYRLARKGITVERQPRKIFIEAFEILAIAGDRVRFRVRCSRGTYVRTLVEDFGAALGAGAHVQELARTAVGAFRADAAVRLVEGMAPEDLLAHAIPMAAAVGHLPAWKVPSFWANKLRRGHTPPWIVLDLEREPTAGDVGRLISPAGELVALGQALLTPGPIDRPWHDALHLKLVRVI
jgi:tRNA pseudouridine55 synthase